MCFLAGCTTTKYIEVPRIHTDTLRVTIHQHDSTWVHDSIYVVDHGDTVSIEKWHTKYILREIHDTIRSQSSDTIAKPYPVEKKVEKPLTGWQWFQIWAGRIAILVLGGVLLFKLRRKI